jgi:hemoglobin-like flavoprotein
MELEVTVRPRENGVNVKTIDETPGNREVIDYCVRVLQAKIEHLYGRLISKTEALAATPDHHKCRRREATLRRTIGKMEASIERYEEMLERVRKLSHSHVMQTLRLAGKKF